MFEGFKRQQIKTKAVAINLVHGGSGDPVLLLHGYPETIRATCEEFRAAATIDLVHDEADKDTKVTCPTLVLWSAKSMWAKHDMLKMWRSRAENVQGFPLNCGDFLPDPERTTAALMEFLS